MLLHHEKISARKISIRNETGQKRMGGEKGGVKEGFEL